jgi:hypothetical protein
MPENSFDILISWRGDEVGDGREAIVDVESCLRTGFRGGRGGGTRLGIVTNRARVNVGDCRFDSVETA